MKKGLLLKLLTTENALINNITTTDVVIKYLLANSIRTNQAFITEGALRAQSYFSLYFPELINLSEERPIFDVNKGVLEILSLLESDAKDVSTFKFDTASVTDVFSVFPEKEFFESSILLEDVVKTLFKAPLEYLDLTESDFKDVFKVLSEIASIYEERPIFDASTFLSDSVTFSEVLEFALGVFLDFDESLNLTDSALIAKALPDASDILSASDTLFSDTFKNKIDQVLIDEIFNKILIRPVDDTLDILDSILITRALSNQDFLDISDTFFNDIFKDETEEVSIDEIIEKLLIIPADDTLDILDNAVPAKAASFSDTYTASDLVDKKDVELEFISPWDSYSTRNYPYGRNNLEDDYKVWNPNAATSTKRRREKVRVLGSWLVADAFKVSSEIADVFDLPVVARAVLPTDTAGLLDTDIKLTPGKSPIETAAINEDRPTVAFFKYVDDEITNVTEIIEFFLPARPGFPVDIATLNTEWAMHIDAKLEANWRRWGTSGGWVNYVFAGPDGDRKGDLLKIRTHGIKKRVTKVSSEIADVFDLPIVAKAFLPEDTTTLASGRDTMAMYVDLHLDRGGWFHKRTDGTGTPGFYYKVFDTNLKNPGDLIKIYTDSIGKGFFQTLDPDFADITDFALPAKAFLPEDTTTLASGRDTMAMYVDTILEAEVAKIQSIFDKKPTKILSDFTSIEDLFLASKAYIEDENAIITEELLKTLIKPQEDNVQIDEVHEHLPIKAVFDVFDTTDSAFITKAYIDIELLSIFEEVQKDIRPSAIQEGIDISDSVAKKVPYDRADSVAVADTGYAIRPDYAVPGYFDELYVGTLSLF